MKSAIAFCLNFLCTVLFLSVCQVHSAPIDGAVMPWLNLLLLDDQRAYGQINGITAGTTVVAVADNEIVASYGTAGKTPNIDQDGDGESESFSFTLDSIPIGTNIYVYFITKGEIFSLYFAGSGIGSANTNVFALTAATAVTLGYIDTSVSTQPGKAIPENNPVNNPLVTAQSEDTDLPTTLNHPETFGLALSSLINKGIKALEDGWGLRAKTYFEVAEALAGSASTNDADTARFFYALTRVAALGMDTYSDGNPGNGLNGMGDILDSFGTPAAENKRSNMEAFSFPDLIPNNAATGAELQVFAETVVLPEILAALNNLDAVSTSFQKKWTELYAHELVESDYGDVIFFKAVFLGAIASIYTQSAYNLDDDIDETYNNDKTIEQFLIDRPAFLTLLTAYATELNQAKIYTNDSLDEMDTAIVWMDQMETDGQADDFVNLGDLTPVQITQARADIVDAKSSLDGPTWVNDNKDPADAFVLDASIFFAGVNFRNPNQLPPFTGNDVSGLFPDPTFSGIFGAGIDLNEDINPADGVPDILQ
jgi:hypothetical protein